MKSEGCDLHQESIISFLSLETHAHKHTHTQTHTHLLIVKEDAILFYLLYL